MFPSATQQPVNFAGTLNLQPQGQKFNPTPVGSQALDQGAVALAKAIRTTESSNNFQAKGASGEYGAYQFTPDTWNKLAAKYGVNSTLQNSTPQQQNEVAYKQIKEWKDEGHNVGQIASMWNAGQGEPDAYTGYFSNGKPSVGVNKMNVKYDVPTYAASVARAYQALKSGQSATGITGPSTVGQEQYGTPAAWQPGVPQPQNNGFNYGGATSLLKQGGQIAADTFNAGASQVYEGLNQAANPGGAAGNLPLGLLKAGGGLLTAAAAPIAPIAAPVTAPIGAGINAAQDQISNIPAVQQFAQSPAAEYVQKGAEALGNAANIAGGIAGLKVPTATDLAESPILNTARATGNLVSKSVDALGNAADAMTPDVGNSLKARYINQVATDYQKIANTYVTPGNTLEKAVGKGKDPITFLSQRGIDPSALVQEGKYATADVAARIATKATAPLESTLQDMLKVAQQGKPPVPVIAWRTRALQLAAKAGLTETKQSALIRAINRDFASRLGRGQKTLDLTALNVEKRKYWADTFRLDPNDVSGKANYYIGKGAKQTIEATAQDAPIAELNNYLGDHYEAAKFLESFDGRKAIQTLGGKIKNLAIKGGATALGESIGGLGGGVAGFFVGGIVGKALENLSNPVKAAFLKNLEVNNPAGYQKAIQYLGQQEAARLQRPLLPAGRPQPIITPAPTTFEPAAQKINTEPNNQRLLEAPGENPIQLPKADSIDQPIKNDTATPKIKPISPKSTTPIPKVQSSVSPELQPLAQEAQKYKSAEELGLNVKQGGHLLDSLPKTGVETAKIDSNLLGKDIQLDTRDLGRQTTGKLTSDYWLKKIQNGERPPILVGVENGKLKVIDGNHRATAYLQQGIKDVPTIFTNEAKSQLTDFYNKVRGKMK